MRNGTFSQTRKGDFYFSGIEFNSDNLSHGIWIESQQPKIINRAIFFGILFVVGLPIITIRYLIRLFYISTENQFENFYNQFDIPIFIIVNIIPIILYISISAWYIYYEIIFKKKNKPRFESNVKSPKIKVSDIDEIIRSYLDKEEFQYQRKGPFKMLSRRILYFIPDFQCYIDIENQSRKGKRIIQISVGPVNLTNSNSAFNLMKGISEYSKQIFRNRVGSIDPLFRSGPNQDLYLVDRRGYSSYDRGRKP